MTLKPPGKDLTGAIVCVLLGAGVLALGVTYGIGTLRDMGPGFVPVAIGALLMVVGLGIGLTAVPGPAVARFVDAQRGRHETPMQWRGWLCILGGIAAFVVLADRGGLVPACFGSVFISALGDRNNTVRGAATLAAILTALAVLVFHYFLSLQMPLFHLG